MGHYAKFERTAKPTKDLVPACFSGPGCRCWPMLGNITAGGEIIGNLAGDERRYFLKDHLGSVRTTVDRNGNIVGRDDYYPFGLAMPGRSSNSSNPNDDYKFTGYEKDDEAGLTVYHANARGYDPVLGRFNQVDPLSDLFPHVSSYAYGNNNPLRFTDPTGMAPYDWIRNNETGEYTWDWNVTSSDNTPEGHTYVGKGIDDIQADYKESTSLLGRMFGSGPDIDWESIGAVVKPYNESDYVTSIGIADNPGSFFAGGPVGVLKKLSTGYKAIQAAKSSTATARALGVAGENAVGIGSKVRIPSLSGTAKFRIPDGLTSTTLTEVKNVAHQSLTRQLRGFHMFSQQTGRQFILYTRPTTTFSRPLQNLINQGQIIVKPIPGL